MGLVLAKTFSLLCDKSAADLVTPLVVNEAEELFPIFCVVIKSRAAVVDVVAVADVAALNVVGRSVLGVVVVVDVVVVVGVVVVCVTILLVAVKAETLDHMKSSFFSYFGKEVDVNLC